MRAGIINSNKNSANTELFAKLRGIGNDHESKKCCRKMAYNRCFELFLQREANTKYLREAAAACSPPMLRGS